MDIVHLSHTDYGFTDHPEVCRELQKRYLDIAIDAVLSTRNRPSEERFCWTAETTVAVLDWWEAAAPQRREKLLEAVRSGQLDVAALPINNTPFLGRRQWRAMVHWLPEDLWKALGPSAAVQNDVNGFPRAGALALLERGIRHLFTGINSDSGGPPFQRPSGFWWKMPDGRRLLVWLNYSYPEGYGFFEAEEWRRGPVPFAADARYRAPRPGEIFRTDEASLRKAHRLCVARLLQIEAEGYTHSILPISVTNQWRIDNDPPFPPLADFVSAWNKLGLRPALRLTTVSEAMRRVEEELGPKLPERSGEWTDWWANGTASAPREVAASRKAKRYLQAVVSPVWGPMDAATLDAVAASTKDLCLFDEHTWGSSWSVALPWSLDTLGQFNEKSRFAYRPMARAEWLLSQRARTTLVKEGEGLFVANPAPAALSGWVSLPATCLREPWLSVEDPATGAGWPLRFEPGIQAWARPRSPSELSRENSAGTFPDRVPRQLARFWIEGLEPHSARKLRLSTRPCEEASTPPARPLSVETDASGWPVAASWGGGARLFSDGTGDILAVRILGFAPRWIRMDLWASAGTAEGAKKASGRLERTRAEPEGPAEVVETPHTFAYKQYVRHPRFAWAAREIEIYKRQERARLTVRFHRISSQDPEILFVRCELPTGGEMPLLSSGGEPFTPFLDQLPGSCRDYHAIDGWARYQTPQGSWLWVSRDAPLLAIGGDNVLAKLEAPPASPQSLYSMVYNNFWYTNFVGDSPGTMEFQYELAWRRESMDGDQADRLAEALVAEPVVLINPALPEHPLFIEHLYRP